MLTKQHAGGSPSFYETPTALKMLLINQKINKINVPQRIG